MITMNYPDYTFIDSVLGNGFLSGVANGFWFVVYNLFTNWWGYVVLALLWVGDSLINKTKRF